MSRLRKLLPGVVHPDAYRLTCEVDSDVKCVPRAPPAKRRRRGAVTYPATLLPESEAPGVVSVRDELDGWLREAVITSDDADALWAWVRSPSLADDLLAWRRLLRALDSIDGRRSRAVARTAALRRELGV